MEDKEEFFKRVKEAKDHREYAEKLMRYDYLVETTQINNIEISDEQKTRISYAINSFDSNSINVKNRPYRNPIQFL